MKKLYIIENENDTVIVTPEDYLRYLDMANYNSELVARLPLFRNKLIIISGSLNLSRKPISSLKNVIQIAGGLDISNTRISDVSGIKCRYISDYGSPRERIRKKVEFDEAYSEVEDNRKYDAWSLDTNFEEDDIIKSHILYEVLLNEREPSGEIADLAYIRNQLGKIVKLENLLEKNPGNKRIENMLSIITEKYDKYVEEYPIFDAYCMVPIGHDLYKVYSYAEDYFLSDTEYYVLTNDEVDDRATSYYMDNYEFTDLSPETIKNYIDGDAVADDYESTYHEWVRESPESYFNDDDYELTDEQESEIDTLNLEIEKLKNNLDEIEDEDEIFDIEEKIEEYESRISEIESEKILTDEMVENYVNSVLSDIRRDPYSFLHYELGYDTSQLMAYFDKESFVKDLISDGDADYAIGNGEGSIGSKYNKYTRKSYYVYES